MNPNAAKQTGQSQSPGRTDDIQKQSKPPIQPASAAASKPVTASVQETSVKPSSAQAMAMPAAQSDVKSVHPSKDPHQNSPVTKAAPATNATLEPLYSAKKPTSGQAQTTASIVKPLLSSSKPAAAMDGQLASGTAQKLAGHSSSSTPMAAARAGIVQTESDGEQFGVPYQRATTLTEAVTSDVRMTEAMLDAMQGGRISYNAAPVEPFSKVRPSVQQVRYPTPYPMTPTPDESRPDPSIRDVDGIEVFKRRRSSVISDSDTSSVMQQAVNRHAAKKSMKAKTNTIDEEHLLSKGERPLRSSIKSGSQAKGKNRVSFSDVDGTELATVRQYFDQDEAPEVPLYATAYLNLDDVYSPIPEEQYNQIILRPSFSQPGAAPDFMGRVHLNKVALEFCLVSDKEMNITGTVRVANIAFSKSVTIRYTIDEWKHATEIKANYVYYSHDGATDRFSFVIQLPKTFGPGQQFLFAVKYEAGLETFWDNNSGQNYKVECFTRETLEMAANSNYLSSIHPTFTWLQYL